MGANSILGCVNNFETHSVRFLEEAGSLLIGNFKERIMYFTLKIMTDNATTMAIYNRQSALGNINILNRY